MCDHSYHAMDWVVGRRLTDGRADDVVKGRVSIGRWKRFRTDDEAIRVLLYRSLPFLSEISYITAIHVLGHYKVAPVSTKMIYRNHDKVFDTDFSERIIQLDALGRIR